jgi:hypothetical protein
LSSGTLFEPLARAQIKNRGGEEDDGCDGEDGVVHEEEDRGCMLRKWSAVDKEVVRDAE